MSPYPFKILYIMGAGRSGSTLLDIILGNSLDVCSCGELTRYAELGGVPRAADMMPSIKEFWQDFGERMSRADAAVDHAELTELYRRFDHHRGFAGNFANLHPNSEFMRYQEYLHACFSMLHAMTGKRVLVDSSKYANRALTLGRAFGDAVHFLYIVRNPVQVCRSFAKQDVEQPPRGYLNANAYYFLANLMCSLAARKLQRRCRFLKVYYEDLVDRPVDVLKDIQKAFGVNMSEPIDIVLKNRAFSVGNLFDGNRLRMLRSIRIEGQGIAEKYGLCDRAVLCANKYWAGAY